MRWWPDIALALTLAVISTVVVDLMRLGSRIRRSIRQLKNKLSEPSVARLRKRIAELERYRDNVALYLFSDRALYLNALGIILSILILMSLGAIIALVDGSISEGKSLVVAPFAIAIVIGFYGMRLASLVTREKAVVS